MSGQLLAAPPSKSDLFQIRGVEIFRVGEWNGDEYTTDDLDAMVAAFPKQGFGVPLKLGHDDTPGLPAAGWVERIYRAGDVLKADFKDLTWGVYTSVLDHLYDHVSCEIYWNLKRDGATYTRALKAVALLGAETPAVNGLQPLREATFKSSDFEKVTHASLQVVSRQMAVDPKTDPNPDLIKALKDSTDAVAALSKKLNDLETAAAADKAAALAALKASNDQIAAMKAHQTTADIKAMAAKCKLPAVRDDAERIYSALLTDCATRVEKFTAADGKTTELPIAQVFERILSHFDKIAEGKTRTFSGGRLELVPKGDAEEFADPSAEIQDRVAKHMAEHKLEGLKGYEQATRAVMAANPKLAEAYANARRGIAQAG